MTIVSHGLIRQALRTATAQSHHSVDALFSRFRLDFSFEYGAFLLAHARALGAIEPVAKPASPRLPLITGDLAALGYAMPPALKFDRRVSEAFRWGLLYALEGSRLGGAMLARRVPADLPRSYLLAVHPKGGWAAFQASMDEAGAAGGDGWLRDAVAGAQAAFALFAAAGAQQDEPANG
ncbi:biliverdin-producing heme oxygenase [Sphingobium sp. AN558]|uniref:biliverdin-producing heme oxygenase n=1 Tax=Sphingobium sp. AN558 TaxID=3133442 RepID=UPI0030BFB018